MKHIILVIMMIFSFNSQAETDLCERIQPLVKSGDVIFISSNYYLFKKVSEATDSWANHVGIAFERDGEWLVTESKVPLSQTTTLCEFIGRTRGEEVAVRRVKDFFTDDELEALWESAQSKMGILYHLGFKYNSPRQFCSKFVYQVFNEALGLEVGEIQTFRQVLEENPEGSQTFWKWWFLGNIPWDRVTVTPKNQLYDPRLETIYTWEDN